MARSIPIRPEALGIGSAPFEDATGLLFAPWEVVALALFRNDPRAMDEAVASPILRNSNVLLDPRTGWSKGLAPASLTFRADLEAEGAALTGFEAEHAFTRTALEHHATWSTGRFECSLSGRTLSTTCGQVMSLSRLFDRVAVDAAGCERAGRILVAANRAMSRALAVAAEQGGRAACAACVPEAGRTAESEGGESGAVVLYRFGADALPAADAAKDKAEWDGVLLSQVMRDAGLMVTDEHVALPPPGEWTAEQAASGKLGATATSLLVGLESLVKAGREGAALSDEPPEVTRARRGLRLAGPAVDAVVGGAGRSARAASARFERDLRRLKEFMETGYQDGKLEGWVQASNLRLNALLEAAVVLYPVAGSSFREPLRVVHTGPPAASSAASRALVVEAPSPDGLAARLAADGARRWNSFVVGRQPTVPPSRLPGHPAGLANLGNTCYLNALVQCLAHLRPLRESLLRPAGDDAASLGRARRLADDPDADPSDRSLARNFLRSTDLVAELRRLFGSLAATDRGVVPPYGLVEAVASFAGGANRSSRDLWSDPKLLERQETAARAAAEALQAAAEAKHAELLAAAREGLAEGAALPAEAEERVAEETRRWAELQAAGASARLSDVSDVHGKATASASFNAEAFFTQRDASEMLETLQEAADEAGLGFLLDGGRPRFRPAEGLRTPRTVTAPVGVRVRQSPVSRVLSVPVAPLEDGGPPVYAPSFGLTTLRIGGGSVLRTRDYTSRDDADAAARAVASGTGPWQLPPGFGTAAPGQCGIVPSLQDFFRGSRAEAAPEAFVVTLARDDSTLHVPALVPASVWLDDFVGGTEPSSAIRAAQARLATAEAAAAEAARAAVTAAGGGGGGFRACDIEARLAGLAASSPSKRPGDDSHERIRELRAKLELGAVAFTSDDEFTQAQAEVLKHMSGEGGGGSAGDSLSALQSQREAVTDAVRCVDVDAPEVGLGAPRLGHSSSAGSAASSAGQERGLSGGESASLAAFSDALSGCPAVAEARGALAEATLEHGRHLYRLRAVVVHAGSTMAAGHYTALVRGSGPSEWWSLNDATVSRITEAEVLAIAGGSTPGKRAYIAAYERIPDAAAPLEGLDAAAAPLEAALGELRFGSSSSSPGLAANGSAEAPHAAEAAPPQVPGGAVPPPGVLGGAVPPPQVPGTGRPASPPSPSRVPRTATEVATVAVFPALAATVLPGPIARSVAADNERLARFAHVRRCEQAMGRLVAVLTDLVVGFRRTAVAAVADHETHARVESLGLTRAQLERWARDELATLRREGGADVVLARVASRVSMAAANAAALAEGVAWVARPLSPREVAGGWGGLGARAHGWSQPPPVDPAVYPGLGKVHAAQPEPVRPWAPPGDGVADPAGRDLGSEEMGEAPWTPVRVSRFLELLAGQLSGVPGGFGPQADAAPALLSKQPVVIGDSSILGSIVVPPALEADVLSRESVLRGGMEAGRWLSGGGFWGNLDFTTGGPDAAARALRGREARRAVAASIASHGIQQAARDVTAASARPAAALEAFASRQEAAAGASPAIAAAVPKPATPEGAGRFRKALDAIRGDTARSAALAAGFSAATDEERGFSRPLPGRLVPAAAAVPKRAPVSEREFLVPLLVNPVVRAATPALPSVIWTVCDEAEALDDDFHRVLPPSFAAEHAKTMAQPMWGVTMAQRGTGMLRGAELAATESSRNSPAEVLAVRSRTFLTQADVQALLASDELSASGLSLDPTGGAETLWKEARRLALPRGAVATFLSSRCGAPCGDVLMRQIQLLTIPVAAGKVLT